MKKYLGYLPSVACVMYYVLVCLMTARLGGVQLIWLAAAVFFAGYGWLWNQAREQRTPVANRRFGGADRHKKLALRVCTVLLIVGLAIGGVIEGVILSAVVK